VTAAWLAAMEGIDAVRPGAYVFGDLSHCHRTGTMTADQVALHVIATVVDLPEPGLALIDAGSKTFSSDKAPDTGFHATATDGRDLAVSKLSEEHGFVTGTDVSSLSIGEHIAFTPTHVCPVVNLANEAMVVADGRLVRPWTVEGRGAVR